MRLCCLALLPRCCRLGGGRIVSSLGVHDDGLFGREKEKQMPVQVAKLPANVRKG